jgi:hypothetical protein
MTMLAVLGGCAQTPTRTTDSGSRSDIAPVESQVATVDQDEPETLIASEFTDLPPSEGLVYLVAGDAPCISCRDSDGLRVGRRFYVHRDRRLIGLVEVEHVSGSEAHCRLLFVVSGEAIKNGDSAITQWR